MKYNIGIMDIISRVKLEMVAKYNIQFVNGNLVNMKLILFSLFKNYMKK